MHQYTQQSSFTHLHFHLCVEPLIKATALEAAALTHFPDLSNILKERLISWFQPYMSTQALEGSNQHPSLITTEIFTILGLRCWRLRGAILLPHRLRVGPFSGLSFHRRRWMSISCRKICIYCKCMPPLTHTLSHLKAYFGQTFSLTRAMQLVDHWAIAMSQREGRITLGELGLPETSLGKNLQILIWISPEPLCSHIPQGNGHFYCCMMGKI